MGNTVGPMKTAKVAQCPQCVPMERVSVGHLTLTKSQESVLEVTTSAVTLLRRSGRSLHVFEVRMETISVPLKSLKNHLTSLILFTDLAENIDSVTDRGTCDAGTYLQ